MSYCLDELDEEILKNTCIKGYKDIVLIMLEKGTILSIEPFINQIEANKLEIVKLLYNKDPSLFEDTFYIFYLDVDIFLKGG